MNHADFKDLLPSVKARYIEDAARDFPRPARVVTFSSGIGNYTYVTLELWDRGQTTYCTHLVCPQNLGAILARSMRHKGAVYFDNGRYGYLTEHEAVKNMYERANR